MMVRHLPSKAIRHMLGLVAVAISSGAFGAQFPAVGASAFALDEPPAPMVSGPPEAVEFRHMDGEARVFITLGDQAEIGRRKPPGRFIADFAHPVLSPGRNYRLDVIDIAPRIAVIGLPTLRTDFPIARAVKSDSNVARLTLNFTDAPVRSVLQRIAEVANVNLVANDSVQGTMSLRLVNVPWTRALEVVLETRELGQRRHGDVIWVAPAAEMAAVECRGYCGCLANPGEAAALVTDYFQVKHADAHEIAALIMGASEQSDALGSLGKQGRELRSRWLSPRGSVTYDERTNTLLINDTVDKIKEIFALVALLDREAE